MQPINAAFLVSSEKPYDNARFDLAINESHLSAKVGSIARLANLPGQYANIIQELLPMREVRAQH